MDPRRNMGLDPMALDRVGDDKPRRSVMAVQPSRGERFTNTVASVTCIDKLAIASRPLLARAFHKDQGCVGMLPGNEHSGIFQHFIRGRCIVQTSVDDDQILVGGSTESTGEHGLIEHGL